MYSKLSIVILFVIISVLGNAQSKSLTYYLPDIEYNPSIPTPESFLGFQIGDWHISHDQIVFYIRELAKVSDRLELMEYARTHENRPLYILKISSPENLKNQEYIRTEHLKLCDYKNSNTVNTDILPTVIYQGYSIHGNEPSGSNAAMLVAYYLAAAQGEEINNLLKNVFILFDPSLNPDGFNRFATWANTNKSNNLVSDPNSRELNEPWPRGRTNHYLFDLNRDWLLQTHPESIGRLAVFHAWRPDILTDHHEMGSNSTYFFMPGIPSRTNPSTPQKNQDLTSDIADFHVEALDSIGSLYYCKESFDDYYHGKGSTYPDANGGVGILFEQASSRGHARDTDNGLLTFPFTIKNHVATSFSTELAAISLRKELLEYKKEYYQNMHRAALQEKHNGYIFQCSEDPARTQRFVEILNQHKVHVYTIGNEMKLNGINFHKNDAFFVPYNQEQYSMVKTIFQTHTSFPDSLFYDVSTWNLAMAFDLQYAEAPKSFSVSKNNHEVTKDSFNNENTLKRSSYAYVMNWSNFYSSAALNAILENGISCKVSTKNSTIINGKEQLSIFAGDIIISVNNQAYSNNEIYNFLASIASKYNVRISAVSSGMQSSGVSLGSPSHKKLNTQNIALIVGENTNSYEVGAAWYNMDFVHGMTVSLLDTRTISKVDLSQYTTIVMADGNYTGFPKDKLKKWITQGGNLVALRGALKWLVTQKIISVETIKSKTKKGELIDTQDFHYGDMAKIKGAQFTGGAILQAKMDITHPLCFGYENSNMYLFRRGNNNYELPKNKFACPVRYTSNALVSGYMSKPNQEKINNKAAIFVQSIGRGQVICFVDNPLFRGYWWGANKLFMNAIYFGDIL